MISVYIFYLVLLDDLFLCSGLLVQKHLGSIKGSKLDIQAYFHLEEKKSHSFSSLSYIFLKKMLAACYMTEVRAVIDLGLLCKPLNIFSVLDPYERCVLC